MSSTIGTRTTKPLQGLWLPSHTVQLDANGTGWMSFVNPPQTLTIMNPSTTTSVNFRWINGSPPVSLAANTQVEFEESEAREVRELYFDSGPANGTLTVTWSYLQG